MSNKNFLRPLLGKLGLIIVIQWFVSSSERVEQWYSLGIYPYISLTARTITGWLPISLGDFVYAAFVIAVILFLYKTIQHLINPVNNDTRSQIVLRFLVKTINFFFGAYICFMLLWGINYYRKPFAERMNLRLKDFEIPELSNLASKLVDSVNYYHDQLVQNDTIQYKSELKNKDLFKVTEENYVDSKLYNFEYFSTKKSFFSNWMSYAGISGYYNPFTGEAQVNTLIPQNFQPFTISHELAHQTGAGAEEEANFIGFLAAVKSKNNFSKYSAFLEAFAYVNSALGYRDKELSKMMVERLHKGVRKDLKEYKQFIIAHQNAIEPYISWYYDIFLKGNNQPKGIKSYNDFVGLIMAYYAQ
ncbi:DUF3810 domain-containing protein [Solitalea koreensis]|uniref:DUF3810 domain-containing protein n=1 Tax=Solitalea koreensis TaxID=543615 RepID=A0A521DBV6_9SPHI|nr:DUF3810 domain-containing protein [Solitalea koreensis]SMO68400.1 Protein of unknown function [Solitalea koreensis]